MSNSELRASFAIEDLEGFKLRLWNRMKDLASESQLETFRLPVGLFLVLDQARGGNATAEELVRRFDLLDFESKSFVDFYFLGWIRQDKEPGLRFSWPRFQEFRTALQAIGVKEFGGNADLILLDAVWTQGRVRLDLRNAIRLDLAAAVDTGLAPHLGAFLQAVIDTARGAKADRGASSVFELSDRLGLAVAKQSLLDWFLDRLGRPFGGKKLSALAIRNLGDEVALEGL
jgi:hypothetical protein